MIIYHILIALVICIFFNGISLVSGQGLPSFGLVSPVNLCPNCNVNHTNNINNAPIVQYINNVVSKEPKKEDSKPIHLTFYICNNNKHVINGDKGKKKEKVTNEEDFGENHTVVIPDRKLVIM